MNRKKAVIAALLTLLIFSCIAVSACVTEQSEIWTPQITQLTDYDDYNLYLADYTDGEYHLDKLLSENIQDTDTLKVRIAELAAPGQNISLNLPTNTHCSVFLAEDEVEHLFGRNFDLQNTNCLLVHTNPDTGYESFAFAVVGMLNKGANKDPENAINALLAPYACMDGMNENGVAIAVNSVDGPEIYQNRGKPIMNAPLAVRIVLDNAADVEDAVTLLDQYDARMIKGYQFFICDTSGKTAIINYVNNETVVTLDEKLMTNFYLCDIPSTYPAGHGQDRYDTAKQLLEEKNYQLTSDDAMTILRSIEQTPESGGRGITQWSVVYHLTNGYADIVFHRHWDDVHKFDMETTVPIHYTLAPTSASA